MDDINNDLIEENRLLREKLNKLSWREPDELLVDELQYPEKPFPRFQLEVWSNNPEDPDDWTDYICHLGYLYLHWSNMSVLWLPIRQTSIKGECSIEPIWYNQEQFDPQHVGQLIHFKKSTNIPCYVKIRENWIEITKEDVEKFSIEKGNCQTFDDIPIIENDEWSEAKSRYIKEYYKVS